MDFAAPRHFRAVALSKIVFGHWPAKLAKPFLEGQFDGGVENELLAKCLSYGFPGNVIRRGPQASGCYDQVGTFPRIKEKGANVLGVVSNDEVGRRFDPVMGKLGAQIG